MLKLHERTGFDEMFGLKQDWADDIREMADEIMGESVTLPNLTRLTKRELILLQDILHKAHYS